MAAMTAIWRALLAELARDDLAELAERLRPFLAAPEAPAGAYTPATLAAALGRSERAIRAAIGRGELRAVKRGRGYVIAAEAVAEWAQAARIGTVGAPTGLPHSHPRSGPGPARRALGRQYPGT
jgi:excisionase family DNA binding protein